MQVLNGTFSALLQKDLQLLEGVDEDSASELEFDGSKSQNISQEEVGLARVAWLSATAVVWN